MGVGGAHGGLELIDERPAIGRARPAQLAQRLVAHGPQPLQLLRRRHSATGIEPRAFALGSRRSPRSRSSPIALAERAVEIAQGSAMLLDLLAARDWQEGVGGLNRPGRIEPPLERVPLVVEVARLGGDAIELRAAIALCRPAFA